jgi:hypothetical protein
MARHITKGLITAAAVAGLLWGIAVGCPPDTIEHHGDVILRMGRPVLLVESCVAEAGTQYTFTYRLTNWSAGVLELCSFSAPGRGEFPSAVMASPAGWEGSYGVASECITWWSWKSGRYPLGPGETLELTLTVNGVASIGTIESVIGFCGGSPETAEILAPSACAGGFPDGFSGCFCDVSAGLCVGPTLFEGEGNRIDLLSGPDEELNGICLGSWVRHGMSWGIDPDRVRFELLIDGSPIVMTRRAYCAPGADVGNADQAVMWHVQFPPDHFAPGTYEVTGRWLGLAADGSVETVWYERTIELTMIECMPAYPISGPTLPDLRPTIANMSCDCGWTPKQEYECEVNVWVEVTNDGNDAADPSSLRVTAGRKSTVRSVPALDPGASFVAHARIRFETEPGDVGGKCPIEIEATADYADAVEESEEGNNTTSTCCTP